ncbi:MAG: type II toxin-antitoxin system Phd/YefM family antitoxin [Candidatus Dormibacteraceae bacterium]
MAKEISVRELRNHTADVVASLRAGVLVSLTVNRVPVADIVPHVQPRSPWVLSSVLREIVEEGGADRDLLSDLAAVRGELVDGP